MGKKVELVRPKINYLTAFLNVLIPLLVCFAICFWNVQYALILFALYSLIRLRWILIFFVRIYQRYASDDMRLSCVFEPTCSEYAILVLKKYGALIGGIKTIRRFFRCRPPGGIDYP